MKRTSGILKAVLVLTACAAWTAFAIYGWSGAFEADLPGGWVQLLKKPLTLPTGDNTFYIYLELAGFVFFTFYLTVLLPDLIRRVGRPGGKAQAVFRAAAAVLVCLAAFVSFLSCLKLSAVPGLLRWFYLTNRIHTIRLINSWLTPASLFLIVFFWLVPVLILSIREAAGTRLLRPGRVKRTLGFYGLLVLLELLLGSACLVLLGIADRFFPGASDALAAANKRTALSLGACFNMLILAPVIEETVFRGIMLHHLKRVLHPVLAVIASALCFGLWHRDPGQVAYTFFWGIIIGLIYKETGKIRHTILLHMLGNLLEILVYSASAKAVFGRRIILPAYRKWLMGMPAVPAVLLFLLFLLLLFAAAETAMYLAGGKENLLIRLLKKSRKKKTE